MAPIELNPSAWQELLLRGRRAARFGMRATRGLADASSLGFAVLVFFLSVAMFGARRRDG